MNEDLTLLDSIFKASQTSSRTLNRILMHTENKALRIALISHIGEYDTINRLAGEEMSARGIKPSVKDSLKEKALYLGTGIGIATNPNVSNIAKTVQKSSSENVFKISRAMNFNKNSSPTVYNLARKFTVLEEENLKSMKTFF